MVIFYYFTDFFGLAKYDSPFFVAQILTKTYKYIIIFFIIGYNALLWFVRKKGLENER